MQSPYEVYLAISGGVGVLTSAVTSAIFLYQRVHSARFVKHQTYRDIERANLERDAYRIMREDLRVMSSSKQFELPWISRRVLN